MNGIKDDSAVTTEDIELVTLLVSYVSITRLERKVSVVVTELNELPVRTISVELDKVDDESRDCVLLRSVLTFVHVNGVEFHV